MFYFRIFLLFPLFVSVLGLAPPYYDLANAKQLFEKFIKTYNKHYESNEEFSKRFEIFKKNLKKLNEWNDYFKHDDGGYFINRFSDESEYKACYHASMQPNITQKVKKEFIVNAPDSIDYRQQKLVSSVKAQGTCGDCFVFAAIETIEGVYAKQTNTLYSLSEQQALDCVGNCNGGYELDVINNMVKQGCMTEEDYPYTGEPGQQCRTDSSKVKVKVTGGNKFDTPDVDTLKGALAQNGAPLAVAMIATKQMIDYQHGKDILNPTDCNGTDKLNHAVLLVGYNTDAATGKTYWIIKNSWGTDHGDDGYYYMDVQCQCRIGVDGASTALVA